MAGKGTDPIADDRELVGLAAEHLATERVGARPHSVGTTSAVHIRAVHPEHGEPVVYVPGELLPSWLVDAPADGRGPVDPHTGAGRP